MRIEIDMAVGDDVFSPDLMGKRLECFNKLKDDLFKILDQVWHENKSGVFRDSDQKIIAYWKIV